MSEMSVMSLECYFLLAGLSDWIMQIRNYWGFLLGPNTEEHDVSKSGSFPVLRWVWATSTLLGPLERANLDHWIYLLRLALSDAPNSRSIPLTRGLNQIQFLKRCVFLEYRTMDRVKKNPSSSACYTPPSEPFRIYSCRSYSDFG
jgi:hypothetical protein